MGKFTVEYKVVKTNDDGTEVKQVKKVTDNLAEILASVQDATAAGGGLEFLNIRRLVERPPKPPRPEVKK